MQHDNRLTDMVGPNDPGLKVVRGGCWNTTWVNARVAMRERMYPTSRLYDFGFRCADSAGD
jgi:formylglycine-generating enzyme required for sulfatase activity